MPETCRLSTALSFQEKEIKVRTQQKHFLENVISQEDYQYFKYKLKLVSFS